MADSAVKIDDIFGNTETKTCIFCHSKILSSLDKVMQFRDCILQTCNYCIAVSSQLFEQINNPEKERYFCSHCTTDDLDFNELSYHLKDHFKSEQCVCPGEIYEAEDCKISFKEESELDSNYFILETQDAYTGSSKVIETSTNSLKKLYKCQYCKYQTILEHSLKTHMLKHTKEDQYRCDYKTCDNKFKSHGGIHKGEKRFHCDICEFKTAKKQNLKYHLSAIHTRVQLLNCNHCEFKTPRRWDLGKHLRIHIGEKPYKCDHCEYKAVDKRSLQIHLRKHSGERPYHCNQCDYKSADASSLNKHYMIHTGEKPYKCDHCEFRTSRSNDLKKHLVKHSEEKPFHCGLCQFKTKYRHSLRYHTSKKHMLEKSGSENIEEKEGS